MTHGSELYEDCPEQVSLLASLENGISVARFANDPKLLLQQALKLRNDSLYAEAVEILKPLVESVSISLRWRTIALQEIYKNYVWSGWRKGTTPAGDLLSYLTSVTENNVPGKANASDSLYLTGLNLLLRQHLRLKNIDQAIQVCRYQIQHYSDSPTEEMRLYDLFNIYLTHLQQPDQAKAVLAQLETQYPKSDALTHAYWKLKNFDDEAPRLAKPSTEYTVLAKSIAESPEPTPAVITEYRLYPNYPNPFNPHTTIGYQLPEAGMVSLKIYNLEGKLVRTLVESSQTAAYHQVQWDATDDAGNPVAAGIYLCQMQAGAFRQTQRLVLLK